MPYPARPRLQPLPQFRGTATIKASHELLNQLLAFVISQYQGGRSLREIAELTDRS